MNNKQYLDFLRQKNKEILSKCYYCNGFAIDILADGYSIRPVCKEHNTKTLDDIESDIG